MKARLVLDIPVAEKHGLTKDRVLEVDEFVPSDSTRDSEHIWVISDVGDRVKLFRDEYEIKYD